jgi:hypothetical protein
VLAQRLIFWTGNRNNESRDAEQKKGFHSHNKDERREEEAGKMAEFDKAHSEGRAKEQESERGNLGRDAFRLEAVKRLIDRQDTTVVR